MVSHEVQFLAPYSSSYTSMILVTLLAKNVFYLLMTSTYLFLKKNPVPLNNILNSKLNKLSAWFATYKLLDHDKKKKTMILTFSLMGKR